MESQDFLRLKPKIYDTTLLFRIELYYSGNNFIMCEQHRLFPHKAAPSNTELRQALSRYLIAH